MDIFVQLLINSIIAGAIYALMAVGFNLIYGTVRFFDLGYGSLAAVGGYGAFFLLDKLNFGFVISLAFGVSVSSLVGFIIYKTVYQPLHNRKSSNLVMLVASLGVFTAVQSILAMLFGSRFRVLSDGSGAQLIYHIFGGAITHTQIVILVTAFLVVIGLHFLLKRTVFGKSVAAIADNEEVAKVVGINTKKVIGLVFLIGSAIAGLTGVLVGLDVGIKPTMGLLLLLKGVVASIIGGVGSLYGGVLGAFLLGLVENFGIWKISGEWKDAISFGLLIIFLLFRPQGILGKPK